MDYNFFQSSDPHSYKLAVSVIQRAGTSLEPYVQRVLFLLLRYNW